MPDFKMLAVAATLMMSSSAFAASPSFNKLEIEATPSSQGTVVIEGVPKYQKKFKLVVTNNGDKPVELTGFVGCYKAFDEKGNEFIERTVQLDLLGKLKEGAKEGEVSFISADDSVYNAKFVKWTSDCPNLAKR